MFTIYDWYWVVANSTTEVWSSKRAASVPIADAGYQQFLTERGMTPTYIPSHDDLDAVLRQQYPQGSLDAYNPHMRNEKKNGGIIVNGLPFATDLVTLGSLNSAYIYTQGKAGTEFEWKLPDGSFITLNKAEIEQLQAVVSDFGQKCFKCENDVATAIDAGTITTLEQVDAAYAAVSNVYNSADLMDASKVRKRRVR